MCGIGVIEVSCGATAAGSAALARFADAGVVAAAGCFDVAPISNEVVALPAVAFICLHSVLLQTRQRRDYD